MATVTATQTITPGEGNLELELITVPDHAVVEAHDESQPPRNAVSTEEPVSLTLNVKLKLFCAGFSFFFAGTNDGSLGPLIPYLLKDYNISTSSIAILYDHFTDIESIHLTNSPGMAFRFVAGSLPHLQTVMYPVTSTLEQFLFLERSCS